VPDYKIRFAIKEDVLLRKLRDPAWRERFRNLLINKVGQHAVDIVRASSPRYFKSMSEDTLKAWKYQAVGQGKWAVKISNPKKHLFYLSRGIEPHPIVAKNKQALHFEWRDKWRFYRSVKHPGTRKYTFWDDFKRFYVRSVFRGDVISSLREAE